MDALLDGDYETSSEGAVREMQGKQIKEILPSSPRKLGSDYDIENVGLREGKSSEESSYNLEATFSSSLLAKSESMPLLKSTSPSIRDNEGAENIALTSESSLARQKKMKMIVARMKPLLDRQSSASNLTTLSGTNSMLNIVGDEYEADKQQSKAMLSVIENTTEEPPSGTKEVTFIESPEGKASPKQKDHYKFQTRSNPKISQTLKAAQEIDDLIDIAENPHPSIKSFYFPPIPERETPPLYSRQQSRSSKNMEAIMKMNGELEPLRHQLDEIRGKYRALNFTVPSMLSQGGHYSNQYAVSSNVSGYYLHRTTTFGRDSNNPKDLTYAIDHSSDYSATCWYSTSRENVSQNRDPFVVTKSASRSANIQNESFYSTINPRRSSSRCIATGNVFNAAGNLQAQESDSFSSMRNPYFHFHDRVETESAGLLNLPAGGSCYRCRQYKPFDYHRPHCCYYDETGLGVSGSSFAQQRETLSSSRPGHHLDNFRCRDSFGAPNTGKTLQAEAASGSGKLISTLDTSTLTSSPQLRVISVNTSVEEHFARSGTIAGGSTYLEESDVPGAPRQSSKKNSDCSIDNLQNQGVSASLMVIGSNGSSRTRYVNYTSVNSQASLVFSKKDQDAMTSALDHAAGAKSSNSRIKELRDLDVQCSGLNLKELIVRKSMETLVKPSGSDESNKCDPSTEVKRIQVTKSCDEKVIIVPIVFTDGIPEPPKGPLFHFARSKCHLPKAHHHLGKLDKRSSSITQHSAYSGHSGESSLMESSYLNPRLRHSGMSVSCVSRTGSSLRYRNPSHLSTTIKAMSDYHHGRGRHSHHSSKAHSEPTKRMMKKVIHGMRSSPEEFLCDT